ncbi:D-tyrosyl-tRNA(Tyr) deacylase [Lutimonas saemankumensis]|uniref:D-aminoacyl-tRNA deacylase n=1 Tax=Lutimonas saemankumensis TaxID=483016 RepID=UPI001CD41933|nr:D-aminoacyl-tRNA deacylase [Lutimonas saemankumensis]MCA0933512.1 D-tyrosyl-tRNA(Tyr) deacylase [Lutimonas saemankumensis]
MKAVIQRVQQASVKVNGEVISSINRGILVLLGITSTDNQDDINWLSKKITNLRIFNDENDVMNLSLKDVKGDALVVSQFTLMASTKKGNRPSYIKAANPDIAIPLYKDFIQTFQDLLGKKIGTGQFGADMKIELVNDGPVTIIIDTEFKQ